MMMMTMMKMRRKVSYGAPLIVSTHTSALSLTHTDVCV